MTTRRLVDLTLCDIAEQMHGQPEDEFVKRILFAD